MITLLHFSYLLKTSTYIYTYTYNQMVIPCLLILTLRFKKIGANFQKD